MSIEEVKKYFKIIDEQDQALISDELYLEPTLYSKNKDVYCPGNDGAWWLLRSPGNTSRMAVTTMQRKAVWFPGAEVDDKTFAIRPAMWIDINFEKIIIEKRKAEQEAKRKAKENKIRKKRKAKNLCQHCGGRFKGIFIKKCRQCNKRKDY